MQEKYSNARIFVTKNKGNYSVLMPDVALSDGYFFSMLNA